MWSLCCWQLFFLFLLQGIVQKVNTDTNSSEEENVRHVIEDGIKSAIFGSNSYNFILDKFVLKKKKLVSDTKPKAKAAKTKTTAKTTINKTTISPAYTHTSNTKSTAKAVTKQESTTLTSSILNTEVIETTSPTSTTTSETITTSSETITTSSETSTTTSETSAGTDSILPSEESTDTTTSTTTLTTETAPTRTEEQSTQRRNQRVTFVFVKDHDNDRDYDKSTTKAKQTTEDYDWWPKMVMRGRDDNTRRNAKPTRRAMNEISYKYNMGMNHLQNSDWRKKYTKEHYKQTENTQTKRPLRFSLGNKRRYQESLRN